MPRPPGKHYQSNTQKAIRALESQGYEVKPALQSAKNHSATSTDSENLAAPLHAMTRSFLKGLAASRKESAGAKADHAR